MSAGCYAFEAKPRQIQLVDEHIDDPDRVVLGDVVVEMLGKQRALGSVLAFDESLHRVTPAMSNGESFKLPKSSAFSHTLDPNRTTTDDRFRATETCDVGEFNRLTQAEMVFDGSVDGPIISRWISDG